MKILYGVSGEGFGHSSRSLEIANFLEKKGHSIMMITYGQSYDAVKDKYNTIKVNGLYLIYKNEKLNYLKTINFNMNNFFRDIFRMKEINKSVKNFNPDICISDMEMMSSFFSYIYGLPLISISNQNQLRRCKVKIPKRYYRDYILAKAVISLITPKADHYIALSFPGSLAYKKKTIIVPGIIRGDVKKINPSFNGDILVYLTKPNEKLLNILKQRKEKFLVYGYNINKKDRNIIFKTKDTFLEDLKSCRAIIATSGFTLTNEALYLKKPYFAIPLKGQFEQMFNALYIKEKNFGIYSEELTNRDINKFLENLDNYKINLENYQNNSDEIFKVLNTLINNLK